MTVGHDAHHDKFRIFAGCDTRFRTLANWIGFALAYKKVGVTRPTSPSGHMLALTVSRALFDRLSDAEEISLAIAEPGASLP
jgi:hypothetical protein